MTAYEAKTHLPRLIRAVERGETVIITRYGKPVALLGPVQDQRCEDVAEVIERMKRARARRPKIRSRRSSLPVIGVTSTDGIQVEPAAEGLRGCAMTTVSSYEAKTHLPRLIRAAERGETVIITRHGKPVAQLGPVQDQRRTDMAEAKARLEALRRRLPRIPLEELLSARHEGHKY